jgi:hypothetical protein
VPIFGSEYDGKWIAFRLFLAELPEQDLPGVRDQLEREVAARQECDTNALRLFFTCLTAAELEAARREIDLECRAAEGFLPESNIIAPPQPRVRKRCAKVRKADHS